MTTKRLRELQKVIYGIINVGNIIKCILKNMLSKMFRRNGTENPRINSSIVNLSGQKIWLWIFGGMFVVPEVLWSPVLTYVLPFFLGSSYKFRNSFIFSSHTDHLISTLIILIQFIGVLFFTITLYKNKENLRYKYIILSIFSLISLIIFLVLFLQISLNNSDLLGFFGFTNVITATTIFTDNFNTYPLYSTLNGQGGWVSDGNNGQVIDYIVYEGEQSARISELNGEFFSGLTKTGTLLNDGQITIYARSIGGGNFTGQPKIELKEGSTSIIKIQVAGSLGYAYYNGDVGGFTSLGPAPNPWIAFQIQWRSSDHKARYNIDGGPWTGWHSGLANWTSGLDTVGIYSRDGVSIFDAIQENLVNYKTPVLIVPGLVGTEIYNNGSEKLWLDLNHNFADIGDEFMDPLSFSEYLYPAHNSLSIGDIIRKPNIIFDYSEGLITELKNQGYIENQDLFTFPYDWRYGVSGKYPDGKTNSDLLKEKIQDILTQTGGDKVDVIAHSLGGLVVKKYAIDNSVSHYIGKAIFVGVPNTGAPKSIKALLQGDNFGIPWLSESEIKKISANMPTAYDLLPTQQYYNTVGSFVKVIDEGSLFDLFDYTEKDLTYDEFKNYATNDHGLNSLALTGAESLHTADFDNFDLRSAGIDLYAIDGCKKGTMEQIVEYRYGDLVKYKNVKFKTGDGTVPISSSTNLPVNSSNKFYFLNADHGKMLSQDGGLQKIVNLITGSNLATGDNITQDIAQCHLNGKAISVYSP